MSYVTQLRLAIKTTICFAVFCSLLPFVVTTCLAVSLARNFWLFVLRNRYPYLEFAKRNNIRSLVDTSRNPGVFHVLLKVEGNCDFNVIRETLRRHVVDRVDTLGRLIFPRLKLPLISCWGHYAWIKNFEEFDINNHVLLGQTTFKGRPITESNIQDYVSSEIVSKYMPHDFPPWQIYIIPIMPSFSSATEDDFCQNFPASYYILMRIHHLIAEEERNLLVSDILMLNTTPLKDSSPAPSKQPQSPFWHLVTRPVYIPKLIGKVSTTLRNNWNEFIYYFDPLEDITSPDVDKYVKSIVDLLAIVLIVGVAFIRAVAANNRDTTKSGWTFLLRREVEKRKLTWHVALNAVLASLDPLKIIGDTVWCAMIAARAASRELQAVIWFLVLGKRPPKTTLFGICYRYMPLLTGSLQEMWQMAKITFTTPRQMYEEFMGCDAHGNSQNHQHALQNLTLCGRKVVAWSDRIERSALLDKQIISKASEIEILLATTSGAVRTFYESFGGAVPETINICARSILQDFLFGKMKYREGVGGLLGVEFPVVSPSHQLLKKMHTNLAKARQQQIGIYLLTFLQTHFDILTNCFPQIWMRILISYLSRRYAVMITEVVGQGSFEPKTTIWGQTVTDAIYFRTPQSNISLSLTIQRYGNHVRLGVMADAQISPHHCRLANVWPKQFEEI